PFSANQAHSRPLALGPVVCHADFQRSVNGRAAAVGEKHMTKPTVGDEAEQIVGEIKGSGVPELKRRREVEFRRLLLDCLDDTRVAMTGVGAPKASRAVHNLPAILGGEVHAAGLLDDAGLLLESAV